MEETEECAADKYLSSWDIKRAFDRVPKNILILSWTRLGVPKEVAAYLVRHGRLYGYSQPVHRTSLSETWTFNLHTQTQTNTLFPS
jgi:hypothetical protein